jgi:hypothetical protein
MQDSQGIVPQRDQFLKRPSHVIGSNQAMGSLAEKIEKSNLGPSLKEASLAYVLTPSPENFAKLKAKCDALIKTRRMLLTVGRYAESQTTLAMLSMISGVIAEKGRLEQRAQIDFVSLVQHALAELGEFAEKLTLEDVALISIIWDEWLFSAMPACLQANSYQRDRPESLCGLLSCLLIYQALGQHHDSSKIFLALRDAGLNVLQSKGKRIYLKAWLEDVFSNKVGFDWRSHREVQGGKWGYVFSLAEVCGFFENDQPLLRELKDIAKLDGHLEILKTADYLKRPEEKDLDVILRQMEAIADTLSERAGPQLHQYWQERSMNALMFYSGILFTLQDPRWKIEFKKQEHVRERVIKKIKVVELKLLTGMNANVHKPNDSSAGNRHLKQLKKYRKKAKEDFNITVADKIVTDIQRLSRAEKLDIFSGKVVEFIKDFIGRLVETCIADFGPAPCVYAFIGFGSFEKNSMTPYSDLEFAVLIEVDTPEHREYFRNLNYLLMARIINLGETPIPITLFDYSFDHLTNRGLSFDLGGKTPLGRYYDENSKQDFGKRYGQLKYQLIGTPAHMVRYIEDEYFEVDELLPVELCQCALICGDRGLAGQYKALLRARMHKKDSLGVAFYQRRALTHLHGNSFLRGDIDAFSGKLDGSNDFQLCDVKQEIYRLPDRLISDLGLFFGHITGSVTEKIRDLSMGAVINEDQSRELKILNAIAKELRLQAYFYYGRQYESLSILPKILKEENSIYKVTDLENIELFYRIAYAFQQHIKKLSQTKIDFKSDLRLIFKNQKFRDYSLMISMKIARRLNMQDKLQKCIVQLAKQQNKKSSYIVADLYNELGASFFSVGEYEKAQENWNMYWQALLKQGESFRPQQAMAMANVSVTYGALGDWEKQKSLLLAAVAILEACPGSQEERLASVLMNLGMVYGHCGDWKSGITYLQRAVAIDQNYYQDDNLRVAERLGSLGGAYGGLGDWKRAVTLEERALSILERFYGPDHAEVAILLGNLGESYGAQGDRNKQRQMQLRAIEIQEAIYGPTHIELALPLTRLGNTYGSMGQWRPALDLQKRALTIKRSKYRNDNIDIAVSLESLGNCYEALHKRKKQLACQQQASDIYQKHYGLRHIYFLGAQVKLGNAYGALGDRNKQIELQKNALQILQNIYKGSHADLAFVKTCLGFGYGALNNWDKQIELQESALIMYEDIYGPDHDQLVPTLINLGSAYGFKGGNEKQIALQERAMKIQSRHFGPNSPEVAVTRVNLAPAYAALDGWKNQLAALEQAAGILEAEYGVGCAEMGLVFKNLSYACQACGDMKRTQELQEKARAIQHLHSGGNYFTEKNQPSVKHATQVMGEHLNDFGHFSLANKSKIAVIYCDEDCGDGQLINHFKT